MHESLLPLPDESVGPSLSPTPVSRIQSWIRYSVSQSLAESAQWRNRCTAMLKRIQKIQQEHIMITSDACPEIEAVGRSSDTEETPDQSLPISRASSMTPNLFLLLQTAQIDQLVPVAIKKHLWVDPAFALDWEDRGKRSSRGTTRQGRLTYMCNLLIEYLSRLTILFYSNSMWLLLLVCLVGYIESGSVLLPAGVPLILVTLFGVSRFPYPSSRFWIGLLVISILFCVAKILYQHPSICDAGFERIGQPWWKLFEFRRSECPPVYVQSKALELGFWKIANAKSFSDWWALLKIDAAIIVAQLVHLRAMHLTGRLSMSPQTVIRRLKNLISNSTQFTPNGHNPVDPDLVSAADAHSHLPIADTYTFRFLLSLCVVILLITDWARISSTNLPTSSSAGSSSSILGESVTRNHFSTSQVAAVTAFVLQMLFDRIAYSRWSFSSSLRRLVLWSVTVQCALLFYWMNGRIVLSFFLIYWTYLLFTCRQLAFQIRPVGRKSGILWQPSSKFSYYLFRLYLGVPFVDELRQICDWVAAPATALSLFMWFKVEDCMQNLRIVQAEMDSRKNLPMLASDRACVGLSTLIGLVAIITGPLVFFSGLNVLREPNLVVAGTSASTQLTVYLDVPNSVTRFPIYKSSQGVIETVPPELAKDDQVLAPLVALQASDLQRVSFPVDSDFAWLDRLALPLRNSLLTSLQQAQSVTVTAEYSFVRSLSFYPTVLTSSIQVNTDMTHANGTQNFSLPVPSLLPRAVYLDSTPYGKIIPEKGLIGHTYLRLNTLPSDQGPELPSTMHSSWWSMGRLRKPKEEPTDEEPLENPSVLCVSERSIPTGTSATVPGTGGSALSISVVGLYLGVVLTIGRFLRLSLQGSSKRIPVEELAHTETLMQLCQGIQMARFFKDIATERRLYYDLIRLFRSSHLLLSATGSEGTT